MNHEREAEGRGAEAGGAIDLAEALRVLAVRDAEIARLRDENRRLKVHFATEQAHSAGLAARMQALEEALAAECARHDLLGATGLSLPRGRTHIRADRLYDQAFNAKAASVGLPLRSEGRAFALSH